MQKKITLAQQETHEIITALLEDGSDPEAIYLIEHHIAGDDFNQLEKMAIECFKLGFEVTDPEETDEGLTTCDILSELPLSADLINPQVAQLIKLCEQFNLHYDGWGTYFESDEEDDDFEIKLVEEETPKMH